MSYDVICVGDVMMDFFVFPKDVEILNPHSSSNNLLCLDFGDKIPIDKAATEIGGSANNVAVGLSRLGLKSAISGLAGKDYAASMVIERLHKEEVSAKFLTQYQDIQTAFSIIISYKGERTILAYHLENYSKIKLSPQSKWLYIGPLGSDFEKVHRQAISLAAEKDINIALNPGPMQLKQGAIDGILRVTKVLILNREEAQKLLDFPRVLPMGQLLKDLKKKGPEVVVITDGAEGAACYDGLKAFKIKAYPAERKESTGAGDAFSAGFLGAIILGKDMVTALRWGVVNSSFVIEQIGGQPGLATKAKIEKEIAHFRWPAMIEELSAIK